MESDLSFLKRIPRRIMVGMHTLDYDQLPPEYHEAREAGRAPAIFEKLDLDAHVEAMKDAHVQAFWFYSKGGGGNAFYPTKVGHMHSALNGRDFFGEMCEKCLSAGITPLCIYESSDRRQRDEHPEWCGQTVEMLRGECDLDGRTVPSAWGEEYGEYLIEQTREVLKTYPVKAYYVDAIGGSTRNGRLISPSNYAAFREQFGFDFPGIEKLTDAQHTAYIRWIIARMRDYLAKVRDVVKDLRPDVAFTYNYVGVPDVCDFVTCDIFPLNAGKLNLESSLRRNAVLSNVKPGEALLDAVDNKEVLSAKGLDGYRAELWTARSLNVATCASFVMPLDGSMLMPQFELTKKVFTEQRPYEEWFEEMEPVEQIGIVNSHDSRKFRPGDPALRQRHQREYEGWVQAATAAGRLWGYVDDHNMTSERFDGLDILILGNASCMRVDQVAAVRDFAQTGGTLIMTGETSLFDADGNRLDALQLGDVAGIEFMEEPQPERCYLAVPSRGGAEHMFVFPEGQAAVRLDEKAEVLAQVKQQPASHALLGLVWIETGYPGMVRHAFGNGHCYYLAGLPGARYAESGHHNMKRLMQTILRLAEANTLPMVRADAPDTVCAYAHRQRARNRFVVNLVNNVSETARSVPGDRFEDVDHMPPVPGATVILNEGRIGRIREVYLAPDRTSLEIRRTDDGRVEVSVPQFDVHAIIVAELETDQ